MVPDTAMPTARTRMTETAPGSAFPGHALPRWLPSLLQLASPVLPTGAFSYSQGLEAACAHGWVASEADALAWIDAQWRQSFAPREWACLEAACTAIGLDAAGAAVVPATGAARERVLERLVHLDEDFIASREAAQLQAETLQVGAALARWIDAVHPVSGWRALVRHRPWSAPVAFALCAALEAMPAHVARIAWGWAWMENQAQAAVRLVPLGQSAGQRLLVALRARLADDAPGEAWSFAPRAAIAAMRHERQYSRLFRS